MNLNQLPHAEYAAAIGVEPYAYVHTGGRCSDIHPSILWNFGDFVTKDESAERSLGLSGVHPPPWKGQNVPKDGTKVHIISIRAKKKWKKCASKCNFLPKGYPESRISKAWEYFNLTSKSISKPPFAEESSRVFSTGIYLLFRDAMGVGKIM